MPPSGPQYLPIRVMADWRCFTRISGFTCASAAPPRLPTKTAILAATRLFFIGFSSKIAAWAAPVKNTSVAATIPSAQSSGVLGHGPDFALAHARGHAAHHAVGIVGAAALLECLELRSNIFGVLAGKPGVLRRYAGPSGAMAAGAGGHAGGGVAAAPELLTEGGEILVRRSGRLELLAGVERREALHVGFRQVRHHGHHD